MFAQYLKYLEESGIALEGAQTTTPSASPALATSSQRLATQETTPMAPKSATLKQQPTPDSSAASVAARTLADKATTLDELRKYVSEFDGCDLKALAKSTVFADGNPKADIMLIGEAPGANEDEQGIPFCGQSGKLLDSILRAIGLDRSSVYITNTVFWRPPANRRPTPQEIEICRPFVEKHVALVNPKVIVLVGSTAVESLLSSDISMHDIRNQAFEYNNKYLTSPIKTTVIFHPSYLLRQPYKKKLMWYDVYKIKHTMI